MVGQGWKGPGGRYSVVRSLLLKCVVVLVSCFLTGEIFLRLVFIDGASFSNHSGPIVQRFERNFRLNHFDGSRGPEVQGPKEANVARVLVQGDSVTWGQGVADEDEIYTSLLLKKLQADFSRVQMAVIARPGREIDHHLLELVRYGFDIAPDLIIYQFYNNDLEVRSKQRIPRRLWQIPGLHHLLKPRSYLWYYLDFRLGTFFWESSRIEHLRDLFEGDTPEWREFEFLFREWATEAKKHTPRVLVVLYPESTAIKPGSRYPLALIHRKVIDLGNELDLATLDLYQSGRLANVWPDPASLASVNDVHPSAMVHALMAEEIYDDVVTRWPDLFVPGDEIVSTSY